MPPNTKPLTDTTVRNAKPLEKARRLFDGGGLYLEISPKGGKWWRLKYRFDGKEKRLSLGAYPSVSLKDARTSRDDAKKLLAKDIDPSEHRKEEKAKRKRQADNGFEVVARRWFKKKQSQWAASHATRIIRRLERDIFPWLGKKPIAKITAPLLLESIRRIEKRGANETAHRALADCGQVFRFAIAEGVGERDPSQDLRGALEPTHKKHFAAITEPDQVGGLLRKLDKYEGTLVVQCALRIAPYVFVRPGELRQAEWAHINLETAEWRYTTSKTETQHIVPLSKQVMAILKEIEPLTGRGRYLFPSARSSKRPMSNNALRVAMRSMEIGNDEMTTHGFRAMARTILDEVLGFRPDYIEHQLAHAVRDPNGRAYNRTAHLPERKRMMQEWADYLDGLRGLELK